MHPLLARQLRRLGLTPEAPPTTPEAWQALLARVERAYAEADDAQYLLQRSLELWTEEVRVREEHRDLAEAGRATSTIHPAQDPHEALLCVASLDGRFLRISRAWERLLGWTLPELTGRPYLDFVHEDDRESTSRAAAALTQGAEIAHFRNRYRHRSGAYLWIEWTSAADLERGFVYASARPVEEQEPSSPASEPRSTRAAHR